MLDDQLSLSDPASNNDLKRLCFIAKLDPRVIDYRVAHIYEHCLMEQISDYLRHGCRTKILSSPSSVRAVTFLSYIMFQIGVRDGRVVEMVRRFWQQSRSMPEVEMTERCQRSVEAEVGAVYRVDDEVKFREMIRQLTRLRFAEPVTGQPSYDAVTPKHQVYYVPWLRQRRTGRSFRRMRIRLEIAEPELSDYVALLSLTDLLRDLLQDVMGGVGAYAVSQWVETDRGKLAVNLTYLVHHDVRRRRLTGELRQALSVELSRAELDQTVRGTKESDAAIFYPDQLYDLTGRLMTTEVALERYLTADSLRQTLARLRLAGVDYEYLSSGYYNYENQASDYPR